MNRTENAPAYYPGVLTLVDEDVEHAAHEQADEHVEEEHEADATADGRGALGADRLSAHSVEAILTSPAAQPGAAGSQVVIHAYSVSKPDSHFTTLT